MTAYKIEDLSMTLGGRRRRVEALSGLNLVVEERARWGIVGESGAGKSTLLKILAGLVAPTAGRLECLGQPVDVHDRESLARLRMNVQMVFQDPRSSLNPRMRIGNIVSEPLQSPLLKGRAGVPADHGARVAEVLEAVGLPASAARQYPHEFSGGERQRIALARALAPNPAILLADEPVSALDVSVRATVLNLLNDLVDSMGLTLVMVTHDLSVVHHTCDHMGVLKAGQLVESGATATVMSEPAHPYTKELLASRHQADRVRKPGGTWQNVSNESTSVGEHP